MKSSARRLGLAVLLFSLAGCGLKGPLYLPDGKQQEVPATPPKPVFEGSKVLTLPPAPQAQKKDRDSSPSMPAPSPPGQSQSPPVSAPDPDRPAPIPPAQSQRQ